ncbi:hypothetical protein Y032_0002g1138 [Ancylostoma ceylanicum]|uniref:Uncharacterized protein n=1 Tax=Ancylostoma ceylanicum TaxID=53326 RepID=A0A016VZ46_9BILA|nr:hypothetical protein Y032_0002g1138 [Ancylostoma ceylanicum]
MNANGAVVHNQACLILIKNERVSQPSSSADYRSNELHDLPPFLMINFLSFQSQFSSRPGNSVIFCKRDEVVAMKIAFFLGFVKIDHYFRVRYTATPRNTVKPKKAKFPVGAAFKGSLSPRSAC